MTGRRSRQRRLGTTARHLAASSAPPAARRCTLPHSAETHLVQPPALAPGWVISGQGDDDEGSRFGTFRAAPLVRPTAAVAPSHADTADSPSSLGLPSAATVAGMALELQHEGLVHVPAALSRADVTELKAMFASLDPDPDSPLDRWSGSASHIAAVVVATENADPQPYADRAIQTLFNRQAEAGPGTAAAAPFLQYLDTDPPCAVAEAVLGEHAHVIQHNIWETPPGRPKGATHVDYVPLAAPAGALASGELEAPVFVLTAHCECSSTRDQPFVSPLRGG